MLHIVSARRCRRSVTTCRGFTVVLSLVVQAQLSNRCGRERDGRFFMDNLLVHIHLMFMASTSPPAVSLVRLNSWRLSEREREARERDKRLRALRSRRVFASIATVLLPSTLLRDQCGTHKTIKARFSGNSPHRKTNCEGANQFIHKKRFAHVL